KPVDRDVLAVLVLLRLDEVLLARVVIALGDLLVHPLERLLLPLVGPRRAVERLDGAPGVVGELDGRRTLRAQAAQRMGRVRVALDVENLVALGIDELAAAYCAVRTDATRGLGLLDLERRGGRLDRRPVDALGAGGHSRRRSATELQEVTSRETHASPPWCFRFACSR